MVLADPGDTHGLAIGIGVNPWYGELDPERMAHAVVDEAIRNVVAVGADPDKVALLDNFSWGDPRRPSTLGELVAAVHGCCDASVTHGAPFVSGKDSLNNEYLGSDGARHAVPPTLVITAIAHVPDASAVVVTPDLKRAGDVVVQLGATHVRVRRQPLRQDPRRRPGGATVPGPDPDAPARYRRLHQAMRSGRVLACHDLSEGGLAVALAEMAIAGRLGLSIDTLPGPDAVVGAVQRVVEPIRRARSPPADLDWLAELARRTGRRARHRHRAASVHACPAAVRSRWPTWSPRSEARR